MTTHSNRYFTCPMCFWSADEFRHWLRQNSPRLNVQYGQLFADCNIRGRNAVQCSEEFLEQLGVTNKHDRQVLLSVILHAKLASDFDELCYLNSTH